MALPKLGSPKYFATLPSTGKEIEYRPYSVKEEKTLLLAIEAQDQRQMITAVQDLITACTFDEVNGRNLTMYDLEYMFLKLRAKSVGETSTIRAACSECEKYNDIEVNIDDVEVEGEIQKDMKVELTDTVGMVLRYPRSSDISKQIEAEKKSEYETTLMMLAACIESIYDAEQVYMADDVTHAELVTFIESLSSSQFKGVLDIFQEMPTVRKVIEFDCTECGHHNENKLEGLQSFF